MCSDFVSNFLKCFYSYVGLVEQFKRSWFIHSFSPTSFTYKFFLQVTNAAVSPKIAALFAEGKKNEMGRMVQKITIGLIFIAFIPLLIFILFGKSILSLWGTDFIEAYWILVILSIGQFFNIATGASGLLLIMTGYEKTHSYISVIFTFFSILFNFILISEYGLIGAAIATAIRVLGENITKVIFVKIKIGLFIFPPLIKIK